MIADELQKHSVPLWGYQEKTVTPLLPEKIIRVYTETSEVFEEITAGIYQFAEVLPKDFIQISSGEIVNFNYIDHLELSGNGNIKLIFQSQEESFVSRRYVARIKRRLGI
ncbi:transcriptional regulator [Ligilactobacillus salitolerans]|uniref:Transcriptional regulator n=1 Tax=Ligilactobacillus salitolerans TaxID=1808352 RepID=A0A401IUI2_9LACO|nr:LytTR family DNA-binding domain-containing protein [Ligilactobacillus salitolerans]GBG95176.1 transcriptional regulator [Ligilactobacillus salitolerans]